MSNMNDRQLEERLARLRGETRPPVSEPPIRMFFNRETSKTPSQQAQELFKQLASEVVLQKGAERRRQSTDDELAERLNRLKGLSEPTSSRSFSGVVTQLLEQPTNVLDSDEERDVLIERLLAENSLPQVPIKIGSKSEDFGAPAIANDDEDWDLPWCVLCNEDAEFRCCDCDNDLYCRQCFRDFHREPDLMGHKTQPFSKSKNQK